MDHNPAIAAQAGFPESWTSSSFIALSGSPLDPPGTSNHEAKALVPIGVDTGTGKLIRKPKGLLRYKGSRSQLIVGTAIGPYGLYVVPLMPDSEGGRTILRVTFNPENPHPHQSNNLHHGHLLTRL